MSTNTITTTETGRRSLAESVVLITGALTGIGRATAIAFAREGSRVAVSGRREGVGQALAAELRTLGAEAEFFQADVRKEEDVQQLVDKTVARFGRLDVAVNNAGTEGVPGLIVDQTPESYSATFDTNVLGVLLSMKYQLRVMTAQKHGSIINISSTLGQKGAAGAAVYAASKHAVEGLTKSAALEVATTGVRVNLVAPGPIDTGMLDRFTGNETNKAGLIAGVPVKRMGLPDEVAQAIVFLGSDKSLSLPVSRWRWMEVNSPDKTPTHNEIVFTGAALCEQICNDRSLAVCCQ